MSFYPGDPVSSTDAEVTALSSHESATIAAGDSGQSGGQMQTKLPCRAC